MDRARAPEAMPRPDRDAPLDYLSLGDTLAALGYPLRLALLDKLRFPHQLKDIRLAPHRVSRDANPERAVARQTVQAHLRLLVDEGLVHQEETHGATSYVANPARLYAITEDLRRLSLRYAGTGQGADETAPVGVAARGADVEGPRLVLVHGVYEGKAFPLTAETAREGAWTVGRRKEASVPLDYDPYVSSRNSVVERDGGGFAVRDVAGSRNGTSVNWVPLPAGGARRLRSGDVVGVGRSLLVFVET